jgi:hypothetical protein
MTTSNEFPKPLVPTLLQGMLRISVYPPTGSIFGLNVKIPVFAQRLGFRSLAQTPTALSAEQEQHAGD